MNNVAETMNQDNDVQIYPEDLSPIQRAYRIDQIKKRIKDRQYNRSSKPLYPDAIDLQVMIDDYFENGIETCETIVGSGNNKQLVTIKLPTLTALVLHLGFENRGSFYDMEKQPHLTNTIKKARERIAGYYEGKLMSANTVGAIFALKNMGWIDKTEQNINQTIREVKISVAQGDTAKLIDNV